MLRGRLKTPLFRILNRPFAKKKAVFVAAKMRHSQFNESRLLDSKPTISVIIPCYNQGQFVDEAVESVLAH